MSRRGRTFDTMHERVLESHSHKFLRLKSGRLMSFLDAHTAVESAHTALSLAMSRVFKLASDEWDLERIEWLVDNLDSYIHAMRKEIKRRRGVESMEERIKQLRNVTGREPAEAAAFLRKADELEAQLQGDK